VKLSESEWSNLEYNVARMVTTLKSYRVASDHVTEMPESTMTQIGILATELTLWQMELSL
jgi:hypothetical protein